MNEFTRFLGERACEVLSIRRGTSVADALWPLRQARQHLAVASPESAVPLARRGGADRRVTGREGHALGIVTVKDLLEEIVGELEGW